ncbi:hypothetical protein ACIGCK_09545 [Microbacterium sp. NPDC078428]|uniref:hypothetical protein n=1 Tax=Microbacterium sp. NPDC078428 TaxID=3364190 RepID=UPI0037C80B7B
MVEPRLARRVEAHAVVNARASSPPALTPPGSPRSPATVTLDDTGKIAELAAAVRPVSRRSASIEGDRARLIAEWSAAHGGSAPSLEVLQQIDRRAWAMARPNKPADLDEATWEARVHDEIAAIDPPLTTPARTD